MSSLDRMLRLLDLFASDRPRWTVEQAIAKTGYSRSTIYRYFKSLANAGLVSSGPDGAYTLGPAVIGLDRLIRQHDPLLAAARPHLAELVRQIGVAAVAVPYREQVVVTHVELAAGAHVGAELQRGLSCGPLDCAAARILLAHDSLRRLRRFHDVSAAAIARAGLGDNWNSFRHALRVQRRVGFTVHAGSGPLGALSVAAPIFGPGEQVAASIAAPADPGDSARVGEMLLRTARRISAALNDQPETPALPALSASQGVTWRPSGSRSSGDASITAARGNIA